MAACCSMIMFMKTAHWYCQRALLLINVNNELRCSVRRNSTRRWWNDSSSHSLKRYANIRLASSSLFSERLNLHFFSPQVQELAFILNKEEGLVKAGKNNLRKMANSATATDFELRNEQRELDRRTHEVYHPLFTITC